MGIPFSVVVSDTEEVITKEAPDEIVKELALVKAQAVAVKTVEEAVIIGADTIVSIDGRILGKPKDRADAARMLNELQGKTHQVYTGVAVIFPDNQEVTVFAEKTDVRMYPMTADEIERYIATGEPMDKAGAYGIQGKAAVYIEKIDGDYNNVVGLPVAKLYQKIRQYL